MNAGAKTIKSQYRPNYENWANQLWKIHAKNGEVTMKDYREVCFRSFAQAKIRLDAHGITYPIPVGTRGRHEEIRKTQYAKIMSLYERLGRPLTVQEIGNELECAHAQDARRRLDILHKRNYELPPISNWEGRTVVDIEAENKKIKADRWKVSKTHGPPIKTVRIGDLLVTPTGRRKGNQTWYQIL